MIALLLLLVLLLAPVGAARAQTCTLSAPTMNCATPGATLELGKNCGTTSVLGGTVEVGNQTNTVNVRGATLNLGAEATTVTLQGVNAAMGKMWYTNTSVVKTGSGYYNVIWPSVAYTASGGAGATLDPNGWQFTITQAGLWLVCIQIMAHVTNGATVTLKIAGEFASNGGFGWPGTGMIVPWQTTENAAGSYPRMAACTVQPLKASSTYFVWVYYTGNVDLCDPAAKEACSVSFTRLPGTWFT